MDREDLPKVLRDMDRERRRGQEQGGAFVFALICGALGLVFLLSACSASVQVSGIGASLTFDPGKGSGVGR